MFKGSLNCSASLGSLKGAVHCPSPAVDIYMAQHQILCKKQDFKIITPFFTVKFQVDKYVGLKMAREGQYFMEPPDVLSTADRTKHHPTYSFCWDIPLLVHSNKCTFRNIINL